MNAASVRIRVWDLPTRIFHWIVAILVVFSFVTGKIGGGWLGWHMKSGYAILALVLFRIVWGVVGSETARFASFLRGPAAFLRHARDLAAGRPRRALGHNPMGGWMVVLMLAVILTQAVSGLFADDEIATLGPLADKVSQAVVARMTAIHYYNGWIVAAVVALHIVAVATYWIAWRENLVAPMWSGWREFEGAPAQPTLRAAWIAAIVLAAAAGFVYWLVVVFPKA